MFCFARSLRASPRAWWFAALLVSFASLTTWSDETLLVAPEAESLRSKLISWSQSLHSFRGDYTITHQPPLYAETEFSADTIFVVFRFDDGNRYMERLDPLEDGGTVRHVISLLDGHVRILDAYDYVSKRKDYTLVRDGLHEEWPEPLRAYLTPFELFNPVGEPTLTDFLSEGRTVLYMREGRRVLVHRRYPAGRDRLNVWFNDLDEVIRFEWGMGLKATEEEISKRWSGDPFNAFKIYHTWELDGYTSLNGVRFPRWARKTWWEYDHTHMHSLVDQWEEGLFTDLVAYQLETIRAVGEPWAGTIQEFQLSAGEIQVNVDLPEAAFEVDIPSGALLQVEPAQETLDVYYPWYVRILQPIPLAVLAGLVLLIGGAAWYMARR